MSDRETPGGSGGSSGGGSGSPSGGGQGGGGGDRPKRPRRRRSRSRRGRKPRDGRGGDRQGDRQGGQAADAKGEKPQGKKPQAGKSGRAGDGDPPKRSRRRGRRRRKRGGERGEGGKGKGNRAARGQRQERTGEGGNAGERRPRPSRAPERVSFATKAPEPPAEFKIRPRPQELLAIDEVAERLESVLDQSPADETELVWLELKRGESSHRAQRSDPHDTLHRTVLVRVLDRGRVGSYRSGAGTVGELRDAVRQAIAQSRVREPLQGLLHLPASNEPLAPIDGLCDPLVVDLSRDEARQTLRGTARGRESALMTWAHARVAVFNSRGIRRKGEVTGVSLEVRCGRRPGGGRAAGAARALAELDGERIFEQARERHASGDAGELGDGAVPVVFSPEASIDLIDLLNRVAFSASAYHDGTSFLREHLGVQVFDRAIQLRDDGTDRAGLPFPFDLEGTAKRPVDLVVNGIPKTPALDQRQAAQLGLPPTAHSITGNDARAQNLFLVPGEKSQQELLEAAEGGLWIGWLDHLECFKPRRVQARANARGVRRIRDGALAEGLPDLVWEDSLLRVLSSVLAIGDTPVRRFGRAGVLGGFSAPSLAVGEVHSLGIASDEGAA